MRALSYYATSLTGKHPPTPSPFPLAQSSRSASTHKMAILQELEVYLTTNGIPLLKSKKSGASTKTSAVFVNTQGDGREYEVLICIRFSLENERVKFTLNIDGNHIDGPMLLSEEYKITAAGTNRYYQLMVKGTPHGRDLFKPFKFLSQGEFDLDSP